MASTRRLAAILAADAVGYSRMMRADEEGTHERFKAHRGELVDPKVREHHGRIVKYTGDGMLAEFPSVVEAVLCAVEVQGGMSRRNLWVAADERISFRIGINLLSFQVFRGYHIAFSFFLLWHFINALFIPVLLYGFTAF